MFYSDNFIELFYGFECTTDVNVISLTQIRYVASLYNSNNFLTPLRKPL